MKRHKFAIVFGLAGTAFGIHIGRDGGMLTSLIGIILSGGLACSIGSYIDAFKSRDISVDLDGDHEDSWAPDLSTPRKRLRFGGPFSFDLRARFYYGRRGKH